MNIKLTTVGTVLLLLFAFGCKAPAPGTSVGNQVEQAPDIHSSVTALDWEGIYTGILPCADCDGIHTALRLNKNLTYTLSKRYAGKQQVFEKIEVSNKFSWDKTGQMITLEGLDESREPARYFVAEGKLIQLDLKGNRISGELADKYELGRVEPGITGKYWKLIEAGGKPAIMRGEQEGGAYLRLDEVELKAQGHSGCNTFSGSFELYPGDRIRFEAIGATKMACMEDEMMDQEMLFFRALQMADSYMIKGDTLQFNRARMSTLAKFEVDYLR